MYLRSIRLRGFKSFPDPVEVRLEPGVAVVVGPNGSGKSNVADAIVWAAGSLSPTELRAEKPEDVLFAGSADRSAAESCEVELLFDNAAGHRLEHASHASPLHHYSELTIARRLERGGDGEYLVNRARVRRTDVVELLADVGLGAGLHSVVGQGRVEQILSSKPAERRALVEEAAGLGAFKQRRHRADLKLARVETQVERARDLEDEVRKRLRPLALQASAAARAEKLAVEIERLRARIAAAELERVEVRLADVDGRKSAAALERRRRDDALSAVLAERQTAEQELADAAGRHEQATASLYRLKSAIERVELRRERAEETARGAAQRRLPASRTYSETLAAARGWEAVTVDDVRAGAERLEEAHRQRRDAALVVSGGGVWFSAEGTSRRSPPVDLERAAERLAGVLAASATRAARFEPALRARVDAGASRAGALGETLRMLGAREAELRREAVEVGQRLTTIEIEHARLEREREEVAARLPPGGAAESLTDGEVDDLRATIARLERRREALGQVNPLAAEEHARESERVHDLAVQREDLERSLAELGKLRDELAETVTRRFDDTYEAVERHFSEVVAILFPGGSGRLVRRDDDEPGIEIELQPAGKRVTRLSLLSGGEKALGAIAFLFALFLARPCPFYVLDEVEAALDDANIGRFVELVRRFSDRAQFVVVTHQKRTIEAADTLYGVTMGPGGVSEIVSKRLAAERRSVTRVA